ncbi:MAG: hypothetical protein ACRD2U_17125 [Terriglobales bacterium]
MKSPRHSKVRVVLASVLSISLLATGCTSQWLSTALADLPVLTQMALNIATLVTTLQSGKQIDPAEITAVQNISAEASRDLSLLQSFYNEYKANPNASTIQKIQDTIARITQGLPVLLQSAHISDPVISARVSAGVNLILTTVASFAALMPQATPSTSQAGQKITVPSAKGLKKQWNQQVCGLPNTVVASGLDTCVVR